MATKFNLRQRLSTTKLKVFEKGELVMGNSSVLMEKITQFLDAGMTTGGSVYSGRTAAVDVAHAAEDFGCSDYKCLTLDCIAAGCDIAATGVSFLPKNDKTVAIFAGCTTVSKFSRTLRNKCKEIEGGLFGCQK
jgi:hypothetical protein